MLEKIITSKTRLRLLVKFFLNISNSGYLNSLANEFNESTNSIRKELNNLSEASYLIKYSENNKVLYKANVNHPLFKPLQKIIHKYIGIEDILENVYNKIGNVKTIALIGEYAKGNDTGLIEVLIVGDDINSNYLTNLEKKLEKVIQRKVKFYISNNLTLNNHLIIFEEK